MFRIAFIIYIKKKLQNGERGLRFCFVNLFIHEMANKNITKTIFTKTYTSMP